MCPTARPRRTPAQRHKLVLALALPAMGALVSDPLLGLVDTAVVGRLGAEQLAALGLGVAVLATVSWVFNFLVYGTTAAVARAVGAGDLLAAGRRTAHAGWVALALGFAVGVTVFVAARPLLDLLGATPELIEPGATYLRIRAVGVTAVLLGYVGHGAFRGVSDTRTPLVLTIAANLLNGALDVVLVFGFGMGLAGAAWATVAAEICTAFAFVLLARRAGLPLAGHGLPSATELKALVSVSRDLFLRTGGLLLGLLAVTSAAARAGAVTLAAHQVLWQVWITVTLLMDGFAIAAQALVGTALGAGDVGEARAAARATSAWGIGGGVAVAGALLLLDDVVPRLLTNEPNVLLAVASAWWLAVGGHALNGWLFVLDGVFMGAADFAYLRTWTLVAAATGAGLAQLSIHRSSWGLLGLWVAIEVMMIVRLLALIVRLRGHAWTRVGYALP